jgi:hypothetical protein
MSHFGLGNAVCTDHIPEARLRRRLSARRHVGKADFHLASPDVLAQPQSDDLERASRLKLMSAPIASRLLPAHQR